MVSVGEQYLKTGNYDNLQIKNPAAAYTLEIPNEGDELYLTNQFVHATIKVQDDELEKWLDKLRKNFSRENLTEESGIKEADLEQFGEIFQEKFLNEKMMPEEYPIRIDLQEKEAAQEYTKQYTKVHMVSEKLLVYEGGVSDGDNAYTTYVAIGKGENSTSITFYFTMTPRMGEIKAVVMNSLPMIVAVIFLIVLVASGFFSGKIVRPIIRLADYAAGAKEAEHFEAEPFLFKEQDEIGNLARELNELYEKLRESYRKLEQKNQILEEENERQEVFMRASSHQLKTPIAAALLLVDGMIHEVGKYKDSKKYLPEVKKQLLSMGKMVEDILYLNHAAENMEAEQFDLEVMVQEIAAAYRIQMEDKKLQLSVEGSQAVCKDRALFAKILDNLMSNAVSYTPEGKEIRIKISKEVVCVINEGITIDEKMLPSVCDPFVSSHSGQKGKGLGLYVANYYCKLTGCLLKIENEQTSVKATVFLKRDNNRKGEK